MTAPLLGLDIGGTRLKAGLLDETGRILDERALATPADLSSFQRAVAQLLDGWQYNQAGIGCKGIINPRTTCVDILPGTLHYLEGLTLATLVHTQNVAADNDARAALAGEVLWGAAQNRRNVLMLTLGTGVGGAILAEGRLLRGANGVAGHVGHFTVKPDGPPCICGNHGCLETFFSAHALEGEVLRALHRGCRTVLTNRSGCEEIFGAAEEGDELARYIVQQAVTYFGSTLGGLIHAFDPELVLLGGQIAQAPLFQQLLPGEVDWRVKGLCRRTPPIVQASQLSSVRGAAALCLLEAQR